MEYRLLDKEEYMNYLQQIVNLFKKSFKREIDEKYLIWRYIQNLKEDLMVCVAVYNDRIVGSYSIFPCELSVNGKIIKAAMSMTTMTDPEFSGRGIFTKLAEKLYFELGKMGYKIVFGFPNNNSHRIFNEKLLWKDIYELPTMSLKQEYLKKNYAKYKINNFSIRKDNDFNLDYSEILNSNSDIRVCKDKEYLRWRFSNNPVNRYTNYIIEKDNKVKCNCIIKFFEDQMDIVEINSIDDNCFEILLKEVIFVNKDNISQVNTWIQTKSTVRNIYEKLGFVNTIPITYFGAKVLDNMPDIDIYNYNNWTIQMGDSDVY